MGRNMFRIDIALGDVLITFCTYVLAFWIRFGGFPQANWSSLLRLTPFILATVLVLLIVYNGYQDLHRPFLEVAASCILVSIVVAVLAGLFAYLDVAARALPRSVWIIAGASQAIALPAWRLWFAHEAKKRYFRRSTVLISERPQDAQQALPPYIRVTQRCTATAVLSQGSRFRDCLLVVGSDVSMADRQQLLTWSLEHCAELYLLPNLYEVMMSTSEWTRFRDRPVISVRPLGINSELRGVKRLLDLVVSLILAVVLAPVWLLVPLAIRLDSVGPVFYAQDRVGENGHTFSVLKFRTMQPDAERETGPVFAQANDGRVTRVGRVLRATRLDELPQLINVIKGEMSLVGPRPERQVFVEQFTAKYPSYRLREQVKPGITGLAQVMGRYDTSAEDKLRYDILYIAKHTLGLDLRILLWTILVVLLPQSWSDRFPGTGWRVNGERVTESVDDLYESVNH